MQSGALLLSVCVGTPLNLGKEDDNTSFTVLRICEYRVIEYWLVTWFTLLLKAAGQLTALGPGPLYKSQLWGGGSWLVVVAAVGTRGRKDKALALSHWLDLFFLLMFVTPQWG